MISALAPRCALSEKNPVSLYKYFKRISFSLGGVLVMFSLVACQTVERTSVPEPAPVGPAWVAYDGIDGKLSDWDALLERAEHADVILIGEQHDNPIAHELELKLAVAVLAKHPNAAVAMEMFERNEQTFVDFYTQGKISSDTLFDVTGSKSWGGSEENWRAWYLPVVDAAKNKSVAGARVIAANAPRAYATFARLENEATLTELAADTDCAPFVIPNVNVDDSAYEQRFTDLMSGHGHGHGDGEPMDASPYFRAQQLWDATMANAVVTAAKTHPKVLLLVGDFHIANQGGLLKRVLFDDPELDVMSVSIQRSENPTEFEPSDTSRADFVIYTR